MVVAACATAHALLALLVPAWQSGLKCGLELDSFISPTTHTYTHVPMGEMNSDALDALASLNLTFGFALPYAAVKPRCGSGNQVCGRRVWQCARAVRWAAGRDRAA